MARALRLEFDGAIYHVMARRNGRRTLFFDDSDRERFLEKLEESVEMYHLRLYAYVLMSNHYHLLLCTPRGNLSQAMQQFQTSYSTYFRVRHRMAGHVYQGRFKAPLVEGDRYLLSLTRYLHLNPVRVKVLAKEPLVVRRQALRAYRWSSYRGYIGKAKPHRWVEYGPLIELVGGDRRRYRAFVEKGLRERDEELEQASSRSSKAIGSESFCGWAEDRYRELADGQGSREDVAMRRRESVTPAEDVLRAVGDHFRTDPKAVLQGRGNSLERDVLLLAWKRRCGLTNRDIGHRLGHADGATIGKRIAALRTNEERWTILERIIGALLIDKCKA